MRPYVRPCFFALFAALVSCVQAEYRDIPTDDAAEWIVALAGANYSVTVIRATLSSTFTRLFPDPAASALPEALLAGFLAQCHRGLFPFWHCFRLKKNNRVVAKMFKTR